LPFFLIIPLNYKYTAMKFFIDTANLAQIKEANDLGILDGVTTNPSLMAKEGIKGEEAVNNHYKTICEMVDGDISAEVISTDFEGIIAEGKKLAAIHPNIVVKVPMIKEGIKAIKWFTENNIKTNCTLVFSAGQAILAAKAGATYVSPFIGRIDDSGWDGMELIASIASNLFNTRFQNRNFGSLYSSILIISLNAQKLVQMYVLVLWILSLDY
jgi:transaldolase